MNEYELVDAITGFQSNLIQGQAVTITILSAYMAVAYAVVAKLTTFRCTFISIMFILFGLLGAVGQNSILNDVYYYRAQLPELRSSQILPGDSDGSVGEATRVLFLAGCLFLFAGALYFIWSIRHPKTE